MLTVVRECEGDVVMPTMMRTMTSWTVAVVVVVDVAWISSSFDRSIDTFRPSYLAYVVMLLLFHHHHHHHRDDDDVVVLMVIAVDLNGTVTEHQLDSSNPLG